MQNIRVQFTVPNVDKVVNLDVKKNGETRMIKYRAESFDVDTQGSSSNLVGLLRDRINNYDRDWDIYHIGTPAEGKIPVTFRLKQYVIKADVRFATEIQDQILKNINLEQNGTRAYACSLPANELGGDFFELSIKNNNLFAIVGDVSGHSFGAALLMAMTKSALQTHLNYNHDPSKIMKELNGLFLSQSNRSMYATMSMVKLDLNANKVELCNAGHLPVLHIIRETGELIYRNQKGLGLGMSNKAKFTNHEFPIQKGDLLILYSDGLIETRDEQMKIRETDHFEKIIKNAFSLSDSPKELAIKILEAVKQSDYSEKMQDDSTLVLIEV